MNMIDIRLAKRLLERASHQQALLHEFKAAFDDPTEVDVATVERLHREIAKLVYEQARLVVEIKLSHLEDPERFGVFARRAWHRPFREQVLDVLEEIGVPAKPRLVSEFAAAKYSLILPPARFATLRRDEENAFRKDPRSRPAWVVPAINAGSLTAIKGLVASSAWPAEKRLIGSRTLRINHLHALLSILNGYEKMAEDDRGRARLKTMTIRMAETVSGTVVHTEASDPARIRDAAISELKLIEPSDLDDRRKAALRIEDLPEYYRFWGRPPVVPGELSILEKMG
jgi:hypothetical protein